ncbi:L-fucose/L-arabinose isomerase family protein [Thioalkalivibrio sp. HK1]|uniref:L-fucose/L-arabinose isomerase family protein n=1 Tax=Thioalkalivibrio sp. HK1 TaxID=1469245 RepID=UPI00056ECF1F|nr:hypothetical protein [Thioalkalivibrio sp. HK1]
MTRTIGVLALARPTFDVDFARSRTELAFRRLDATGERIVGPRELLFDADAASKALQSLPLADLDRLIILQVTFTDASMTTKIATEVAAPLAIWALPEPRIGGRLRLNAYCGLNLAAHALRLVDAEFSYLYADPSSETCAHDLAALLAGERRRAPVKATKPSVDACDRAIAERVVERLSTMRIARIGEHPDGFHTCAYNADALRCLTGIEVDRLDLDDLFARAERVLDDDVARTRSLAACEMVGLDDLDQDELDKSLRLKNALDDLHTQGGYDAFAIRCWPETFTEYGGAVCGPVAMMGERRVPCACEADVFGALTGLVLQELAGAPAFQVDLVDVDRLDGTSVVWHCGQAPISMADPQSEPRATVHTNRRKPLLYEFALKPGRVTFARFSQSEGRIRLMIAGGEMLRRPKAFTGTSGVVAYDAPVDRLEATIMGAGLEHHSSLVYGDYRSQLRAIAERLSIEVIEIA